MYNSEQPVLPVVQHDILHQRRWMSGDISFRNIHWSCHGPSVHPCSYFWWWKNYPASWTVWRRASSVRSCSPSCWHRPKQLWLPNGWRYDGCCPAWTRAGWEQLRLHTPGFRKNRWPSWTSYARPKRLCLLFWSLHVRVLYEIFLYDGPHLYNGMYVHYSQRKQVNPNVPWCCSL